MSEIEEAMKEAENIIRLLENKYYTWLNVGGWRQIQGGHRYFMVDEKFRAKLDQFLRE